MEAAVKWERGLAFTGTAESGYSLPLGPAPETGEPSSGFRPMELLLVGLAGCTAMDTISILQKKRQDVSGFEVRVHGERRSEHPTAFTHITLEYVVHGRGVERAAVERAIELSTTKYCAAHATLGKGVPIDHTYRIVEEPAVAGTAG